MFLIINWKEFSIELFPTSRCPIQEIWFEGKKEILKIRGTPDGMTDYAIYKNICKATAVQTSEYNRSLNCWYYMQDPLSIVNQTNVTDIYHALNNKRKNI